MVPVVSYLALRGRCGRCHAKIPLRVLVTEAGTGAIFLGLALQYGLGTEFAVLAAAASLLIVIVGIDWEHQLILDVVSYPAAVAALALAAFWPEIGFARSFWGDSGAMGSFLNSLLTGLGLCGAFALVAKLTNGLGWGDVKLVLVLGFLLGYPAGLFAVWLGAIAGGMYGMWLIVVRKKGRKSEIPYGPFLAGGGIAALFLQSEVLERYYEITASMVTGLP